MVVVVSVHIRDNLPSVCGPFDTEAKAQEWIDSQDDKADWNYWIVEVINIEEINQ